MSDPSAGVTATGYSRAPMITDRLPSQKVTAAATAGAVVTILAWIVSSQTTLTIPAFIEEALEIVAVAVIAYWVRETRPSPSAIDTLMAKGFRAGD